MLTIASLTLREAVRRRIVLVAALATVAIVIASAWGLGRLVASVPDRTAGLALVSVLTIFLAFVFSVVLALGAAFLAAPAIAGDVESGIALAILPRPLSRAEFVLGKWLGLAALLVTYATLFGAVEVATIALVTGYRPPHPAIALAYLVAQSIVLLSLSLLLSTRLPPVAGGLLAVLCFGVAWIAGITANIAAALHNENVLHATTLVGLLVPSDGLWRGALYHLQPVVLLIAANAAGGTGQNPFGTSTPPTAAFLAWTVGWVALTLALALASFARRDL